MANGMVQGAEEAVTDERHAGRQLVGDRVDTGHIQRLVDAHLRQEATHGAGK